MLPSAFLSFATFSVATLAFAHPSTYERSPEQVKLTRNPSLRKTHHKTTVSSAHSATETPAGTHSYVENWAGAAISQTTATYNSVSAVITVPTLSIPSGGDDTTQYTGVTWVGIDGDTCNNVLLQTGIGWFLEGSTATYYAWYEWYPDEPSITHYSETFPLEAGDSVTLQVEASSTTSGTASVTNHRTGQTISQTFSGQATPLCQFDADWIVENYYTESGSNITFMPFADFGSIDFESASAGTISGDSQGPGDANTFDIQRSDVGTLTSSNVTDTTVQVDYV